MTDQSAEKKWSFREQKFIDSPLSLDKLQEDYLELLKDKENEQAANEEMMKEKNVSVDFLVYLRNKPRLTPIEKLNLQVKELEKEVDDLHRQNYKLTRAITYLSSQFKSSVDNKVDEILKPECLFSNKI